MNRQRGPVMTISILLALILSWGICSESHASQYVSLNGGFYFSYPDSWTQIDYNTVDVFLTRNRVGLPGYGYEAVFADSLNNPFFLGNYLILTLDTSADFGQPQIDSVLKGMIEIFGQRITYFPTADYLANLQSNSPSYDSDSKVATVLNELTEKSEGFKKNLLMLKFYERGVARFYFYSPDSLFEESKSVFRDIVASFTTEDFEAALPQEEVRVTEVTPIGSTGKGEYMIFYLFAAAAAIILAIAMGRKRKRAGRSS